MKVLLILSCVLVAVLAEDEKYTDKYDNINIEEILQNKRLFNTYAKCILDKGKCNSEGKELRSHVEDALSTGCSKCTQAQQDAIYTVAVHIIKNELELWRELSAKYDPDHKYRQKYEERARERGIVIPEGY